MRTRSLLIWAAAVGAFVLIGVAVAERYQTYQTRLDAANKAAEAERNFGLALDMANKFLDQVLTSFNGGVITAKGGKDLIKTSEDMVREVQAQSPSTTALRVKLLLTKSDLLLGVGDDQRALATAQLAQRLAGELVAVDADVPEWQKLVFESAYQIGDAAPGMALEQFRQAQTVAARWALKLPQADDWQARLAFIDDKVGETLQSQGDYSAAPPTVQRLPRYFPRALGQNAQQTPVEAQSRRHARKNRCGAGRQA